MAFVMTFDQRGTFAAKSAAEQWLREHGYSFGATDAVSKQIAVKRGDHIICKWRNLSYADRAQMDGKVTGDFRDGPLTLTLMRHLEAAKPAGGE